MGILHMLVFSYFDILHVFAFSFILLPGGPGVRGLTTPYIMQENQLPTIYIKKRERERERDRERERERERERDHIYIYIYIKLHI